MSEVIVVDLSGVGKTMNIEMIELIESSEEKNKYSAKDNRTGEIVSIRKGTFKWLENLIAGGPDSRLVSIEKKAPKPKPKRKRRRKKRKTQNENNSQPEHATAQLQDNLTPVFTFVDRASH